jgi:hypothetical protein
MDDTYIYFGNLPYDANERMIRDILADTVTVEEVKLALAKSPNEPGGTFQAMRS